MRINRRSNLKPRDRAKRSEILELLLGPNGAGVFESSDAAAKAWELIREKLSPAFERQWHAAGNAKRFTETARQYCLDVLANRIPACIQVHQACQRHLDDLARIGDPSYPHTFDPIKADRVCRFIEMLPHVKGSWAAKSQLIRLEPWQIFIVCAGFGWVKKATGLRRFSMFYIEVGRKNAKSTLVAGIGNYLFACDGEFGSEVYSGATSEKQAFEVFRPALQMMQRSPELAAALGVRAAPGPGTKKMNTRDDGSRFEPVIGKPGDGASPHGGIVDEYHEHDSDALLDTLRTGQGAREQPGLWVITTAGDNLAGPCKLLQEDVLKILDGSMPREELFGIIYTIDEDDDWDSDEALAKANPNIGVSVFREFLVTERNAALASARKQGVFKTKHLCVWVGANAAYFNSQEWRALGDPTLKIEDFVGLPCVLSIDLSTKSDITARAATFKKIQLGKEHYYIFMRFYIPEAQVLKPENQHYQQWVKQGHLIQHAGSSIDFDEIKNEAVARIKQCRAHEFAFDPWNAHQFAQDIKKDAPRVEIVEFSQGTAMLTAPTKEVETLIGARRIHHEGNPVMNWMIGNVVAHEDKNENVFPQKPAGRAGAKIDGAIAGIMGVGRLMAVVPKKSIYATRGVRTLPAPGGVMAGARA